MIQPKRLLAYSALYLLASAGILMLQNFIKYGGLEGYDPSIAYIYLAVSILGFLPFVPLVHWGAGKFKHLDNQPYTLISAISITLIVGAFFFISNAFLFLLGYFDGWVAAKYVRWYFGKEALFHTVLLAGNFYMLKKGGDQPDKIVVAVQGRKEVVIKASVIEWIEADDHYLKIHTAENSLLKRATMEKMASELEPDFVRVHRKYMVNKNEVVGKEKSGRDEYLIMKTGAKVKVGRSYQPMDLLAVHA